MKKVWKFIGFLARAFVVVFYLSLLWVGLYAFLPISITPLMVMRAADNLAEAKPARVFYQWRSRSEISPFMEKALIAAEDANFYGHIGFDFEAINKAWRYNLTHKNRMKGGSTISQQLAKNLFLWPDRSWPRKILEAYFTGLIELFWSKDRILEVYMNVIELGDGVYGVEAASKLYLNKSAEKLSRHEAALLAAVLPNPRKWSAKAPGSYVRFRQNAIVRRMRHIEAGPSS